MRSNEAMPSSPELPEQRRLRGQNIKGSSDEARTVRDLKGHQAVVLPTIGEFGGRIKRSVRVPTSMGEPFRPSEQFYIDIGRAKVAD
jgi:hypothetical protein